MASPYNTGDGSMCFFGLTHKHFFGGRGISPPAESRWNETVKRWLSRQGEEAFSVLQQQHIEPSPVLQIGEACLLQPAVFDRTGIGGMGGTVQCVVKTNS